jgi:hypothetical protein
MQATLRNLTDPAAVTDALRDQLEWDYVIPAETLCEWADTLPPEDATEEDRVMFRQLAAELDAVYASAWIAIKLVTRRFYTAIAGIKTDAAFHQWAERRGVGLPDDVEVAALNEEVA